MAIATNSNGNRDDELELIRQLLIATASRAEATDTRLDRLVESQERTQRQLDQLSGSFEQLSGSFEQLIGKVEQLSGSVEQLTEDVEIAFQTISALSNNTDRTLASINASIQRQDRILDYLMRRDGNGE